MRRTLVLAISVKHIWNASAIAQWIRLRLPSSGPGLDSQAHHLSFDSQILYYICHCIEKRTKMGLAHI